MKMDRLIHAMLFTPLRGGKWGLPGLFVGSPGCGKTDVIRSIARRCGLPCVVLSPGTHGDGAFGVVPVPGQARNGGGMILDYPPPRYVEDLAEGGLVFLDEVLSTERALQKPLLGMIQGREVGFARLHGRVRVLGAGNPIEESAGGCELGAPVANRMGWVAWESPTEEEWADWLLTHGGTNGEDDGEQIDAQAEEARVIEAWSAAFAAAAGLVAAFHRRRPGLLLAVPKANDPALHQAWPSHRTWEYATRALAAARIHGLDRDEMERLVGAFVGEGARDEFLAFLDAQDLPDPAEVLDGRTAWKHEPTKLDRTYVTLGACVALALSKGCPNQDNRIGRLWEMIGEVNDAGAVDVTVGVSRTLVKAGQARHPKARRVLAREADLLGRAGMGR